jgi:NADP-reducing hydrogenase subunit HndC
MGITLREVIFDIGGGIRNGKKFKAVQTGGPSGGCLTEKHLDTPIDYDNLIAWFHDGIGWYDCDG